jgi:anti-sigma B factor antagonist
VPFQIQVERDERVGTVRLDGEFDLSAADRVEEALRSLEAERPAVVVIDLRGVTFLDSTGLRTITSADARARDGDYELRIVRAPEAVQKLLHVTGMDKILPLVDDPSETAQREQG